MRMRNEEFAQFSREPLSSILRLDNVDVLLGVFSTFRIGLVGLGVMQDGFLHSAGVCVKWSI
jgi:hypothetical protein